MVLRLRATVVAILAVALLVAVAVPGPIGSPLRRLVNTKADGPDPLWNVAVDGAALRRAHGIVRKGETYYIQVPEGDVQLLHDLSGGAFLFLSPAFPLRRPGSADWLLVAGTAPGPAAAGARRVVALGPDLMLVRRR